MRRLHWFTGACLLITCFLSFSISTLVLHKRSKSTGGFIGIAKKINGVMEVVVPPMVVSPGQVFLICIYFWNMICALPRVWAVYFQPIPTNASAHDLSQRLWIVYGL